MNCPYCNVPMKELPLPSETHYGATTLKKLIVCTVCGYEREVVGGSKVGR